MELNSSLPAIGAALFALLFAACGQPASPDPVPETPTQAVEAETAPAPMTDPSIAPLAPPESDGRRAYEAYLAAGDRDMRFDPLIEMCASDAPLPFISYQRLTAAGYQDSATAAYQGTIYLQVASFSDDGSVGYNTLFFPPETFRAEQPDEPGLRIYSTRADVAGFSAGFLPDGSRDPTYDFEEVAFDEIIWCQRSVEAAAFLTDMAAGSPLPVLQDIRYSLTIRSETNLEGMCEYMHDGARAALAETLAGQGLNPVQQIAEAPNNDMAILLVPEPNDHDMAAGDCRYQMVIDARWTDDNLSPLPARNQNYESGYEMIFDGAHDAAHAFKARSG